MSNNSSWFCDVLQGPPIEVFALNKAFAEDTFPNKVSLGVGAYRTDEGKPWVLPVVRQAEKVLADDVNLNKEYLPVLGFEAFSTAATKMLLGENSVAIKEGRTFGVQTLSGTGALRVGAEFLAKVVNLKTFYYSKPTWENHKLVFTNAGFEDAREYRYWDPVNRNLDINGFLEDLRNAPERSVIILHPCAHNPTGCDPTEDQWKQIAEVIRERRLFPFFDSAYQGFATGDLVKDAWAVRFFVEQGFELFCSQSFAKNFGLYNERVGNLTVVMSNVAEIPQVKSQITLVVRGMYSNPPSHGALIVSHVLSNPALYEQWQDHIRTMSSRIVKMRKLLRENLEKLGTPGDWSHITSQIGMFSYTGLNEIQSNHMIKKHHVYMLKSGRISMCGLTPSNVEYVAKAINETVTSLPNKLIKSQHKLIQNFASDMRPTVSKSFFHDVKMAPPISILAIFKSYMEDTNVNKINLIIGAYRTNEGKPWILPAVHQAEISVLNDDSINKEYCLPTGSEEFADEAVKLLLGEKSPAIIEHRALGIQCLSGTGGLRISTDFLHKVLGYDVFYYSNPTWDNHKTIFPAGGATECREYRYWCNETRSVDIAGLLEDLNNAPSKSVILLQTSAHNPTGCDLTKDQWMEVAKIVKRKGLFPLFDSAFQGLATGDYEEESWPIKYFMEEGIELFCVQAFCKNFGLYSYRVGCLVVVMNEAEKTFEIKNHINDIILGMYLCPPMFGAHIITRILKNNELRHEWKSNLFSMVTRMQSMRTKLYEELLKLNTPGHWDFISKQKGFFCYWGPNEEQSLALMTEHHIYIPPSGRIGLNGLNTNNLVFFAKALDLFIRTKYS